jgi:hypothetical protein
MNKRQKVKKIIKQKIFNFLDNPAIHLVRFDVETDFGSLTFEQLEKLKEILKCDYIHLETRPDVDGEAFTDWRIRVSCYSKEKAEAASD